LSPFNKEQERTLYSSGSLSSNRYSCNHSTALFGSLIKASICGNYCDLFRKEGMVTLAFELYNLNKKERCSQVPRLSDTCYSA